MTELTLKLLKGFFLYYLLTDWYTRYKIMAVFAEYKASS